MIFFGDYFSGNVEIENLLIQKGANVSASSNNGYTVLHEAADRGEFQYFKVINWMMVFDFVDY